MKNSKDPKLFRLIRDEDETGISGTGAVAFGAKFNDGTAVMRWAPDGSKIKATSTTIYDSMQDLIDIHGHEGRTKVQWVDNET